MLVVIDEFTRECLALEVGRKFIGDNLVEVLIDLFAIRGVPKLIRSDNGPEFISRRVRNFLESIDVGTSYIEPGIPWQHRFVESFNSRFRDECLNCGEFATVQEHVSSLSTEGRPITTNGLTVRLIALPPPLSPRRFRLAVCRFNSSRCTRYVESAHRTRTNYPTHSFISAYLKMGSFQPVGD